ncbi:MAG: VOC family protein [Candidatus Peregrinibacteria bacterium]
MNIVARDLRKLADFYVQAFGCTVALPEGTLSGEWLERGVGIPKIVIKGITLTMPGFDKNGPMLEIFQYNTMEEHGGVVAANRQGIRHFAFHVDDVLLVREKVLIAGGKTIGEISQREFKSGTLTFIYVSDPEGNIIELLNWKTKV